MNTFARYGAFVDTLKRFAIKDRAFVDALASVALGGKAFVDALAKPWASGAPRKVSGML